MARSCALIVAALVAAQSLAANDFPIQGVVISDNVRIRLQPSVGGQILGKADHGTALTVLAKSKNATAVSRGGERNWWYQVETADHRKGWMYGAFVYLEAKDERQKTLAFKIGLDGGQTEYSTRVYTYDAYGKPGQTRSLICLSDGKGDLQFIHLPENLAGVVRSIRNEDQWYVMVSDRKSAQLLQSVSVMEEKNLVTFMISEQAGAAETYRISLTCSYNPDKRYFQVEFSETVPQ